MRERKGREELQNNSHVVRQVFHKKIKLLSTKGFFSPSCINHIYKNISADACLQGLQI